MKHVPDLDLKKRFYFCVAPFGMTTIIAGQKQKNIRELL